MYIYICIYIHIYIYIYIYIVACFKPQTQATAMAMHRSTSLLSYLSAGPGQAKQKGEELLGRN